MGQRPWTIMKRPDKTLNILQHSPRAVCMKHTVDRITHALERSTNKSFHPASQFPNANTTKYKAILDEKSSVKQATEEAIRKGVQTEGGTPKRIPFTNDEEKEIRRCRLETGDNGWTTFVWLTGPEHCWFAL
ncbi:hypothetical protein SeMB42_g05010 [Synchytrium endobioticum]|uniref:Uncharacterized protein n=1 Tax=Synchytrium endobioticum TaxID=286115 RepID=A0A507CUB7_9FUNG|nr:hypothetical protein SeMB42_g05010 [Synchytrium endobioticum]